MLKKKELSKKKNLLMVLWDDSIAFRVLFFILAYLVLGFINMPFEKWPIQLNGGLLKRLIIFSCKG